jgi:glycine betaine/proline transport system ATP-binding protein
MPTQQAARPGTASDGIPEQEKPVKLACHGVWKVFGHGAERFLAERNYEASYQTLEAAGMIGAVRNVDIEVRSGEIFIIMGLSGSGKSTLVRCLSRLVEPTAGQVLFDGQDLMKVSESALIDLRRHKMGMVFQQFALLPHLTVLQNVAFPLEVQRIPRAEREERARKVIDLVGLKGREGYYPRELSGGQQQRVGIARSLAVEPEVWFLDEPFSALDPLIRREMQDEFVRLQSVLHKTIVFITHDFDEAIRLADRIAIMKDGEIIQIGRPEDLVTRPATDYVAEFTREVSWAKVLTAGSIMTPASPAADMSALGRVARTETVETIASRVLETREPVAVTDESGAVIGEVGAPAVLDVLARRWMAA